MSGCQEVGANVDDNRRLVGHFLAALAYRTQKALRSAPADFGTFLAAEGVRTWYMFGICKSEKHDADPLARAGSRARMHGTPAPRRTDPTIKLRAIAPTDETRPRTGGR